MTDAGIMGSALAAVLQCMSCSVVSSRLHIFLHEARGMLRSVSVFELTANCRSEAMALHCSIYCFPSADSGGRPCPRTPEAAAVGVTGAQAVGAAQGHDLLEVIREIRLTLAL